MPLKEPENVALTAPKGISGTIFFVDQEVRFAGRAQLRWRYTACQDREILDVTAQAGDSASPNAGLLDSQTLDVMEQLTVRVSPKVY